MKEIIETITNNNYRVLKLLSDNQVQLDGSTFIPLTQAEIAQKLNLSKVTINNIFKDLQEKKLVYQFEGRNGKYCLTDTARDIVKGIEKLNEK